MYQGICPIDILTKLAPLANGLHWCDQCGSWVDFYCRPCGRDTDVDKTIQKYQEIVAHVATELAKGWGLTTKQTSNQVSNQ